MEESRAVGKKSGGDAAFGIGGAKELVQGDEKVSPPCSVTRTKKKMLVCFNGTSVAAAAVRGMTIMVAKKAMASGEKVVDPFGEDDTLI